MTKQVAPQNVVGRDELIERIWKRLEKTSIRFTAERRVGKTTVMTKMAAEPRPGFEVLFMELEGIDSPERFVELLISRLKPLLSQTDRARGWWDDFRNAVGGTEVAGVFKLPSVSKMDWQAALTKTLEGACEHQGDKTILLLMDELPYMLQKIASIRADGEPKTLALTLLDTLRSIRQQHKNIRMVFAGSVGLHHVASDLKQGELASEPTNDMPLVEIRALSELDAIEQTVRQQLSSPHDPWEMEHFRERLGMYYNGALDDTSGLRVRDADIARTILDHLAITDEPQCINQIWGIVKSNFKITDRNHIVEILKSLALDHYLDNDADRRYSFRFPLIQRWWKMAQGIN